ncbi:mandelate racemase/muconate lactonizing enzyme family protein [Photobacterium rosenbergii]|uniref:Mandelate racemase/muconate lactonizing enzyme family protein n=1 Tax=Photobacterium rosenbergii TaxID=294936 RepID=A0A2T3NKQ4_9GAMM|nr:mandelate racemase/muconate lactonizing enzyme family protein [Photobacterium rosenbergii]PSW16097.1 mandelate racemase/muconate lactonizing enzyme family protein [Photobacterium rosenbergii]
MKIIDVKPHAISVPLDTPFYFSQGWVHNRSAMIIEVITDEGVTGYGEALCHGLQSPQIAASIVEHTFKPLLLGRSPFDVEVLWEEMYNTTRPFGQAGAAVNAISGVDIALWDVIGKSLKKPIHQLIGGAFRKEVTPYATGFYRVADGHYPNDSVDEAFRYIEAGFTAFKLKIGFGVDEDIKLIRSIREAVGINVRIMADANGAYNASTARRIIKETEEFNLFFLEELLAPEDIGGYQEIKTMSKTPIAAGEQIFGKMGYRPWLESRALDIIQPDLCSSGGFTECKKIAAMAQANHINMIPHVWGSGIGIAASLQFIASIPSSPLSLNPQQPMLEFDQSSHPFRKDLIFDGIQMENGKVQISTKPGIGVDVNPDVIYQYKVN